MRHDPPLVYDCIRCGHSCRSFEVQVEVDEARRLNLQGPNGRPGFITLPVDERGCGYLTSDSTCRLHLEGGPQAKPSACRSFPLVVRQTPDGLFTGVSFCCTAVRTQQGRPLRDHDLAAVKSEGIAESDYAQYLLLEPRLRQARDEPAVLLETTAQELAPYVLELVLILEAGRPENIPTLYAAVAEGTLPSRLLGQVVSLGQPWWTCRPPAAGLAHLYLDHVLHRKDLALMAPELATISFVLRTYLLRWYAHACADWSLAVDIVERHAGLHASGLEPFFLSVAQRLA
ncbi:MAG: hypothetical protein KC910_23585 [Candidatus Eremiobacteraeota bacterium]|nr:hypothetical protein [Candidatus Eremiobacteraeota bacterium]